MSRFKHLLLIFGMAGPLSAHAVIINTTFDSTWLANAPSSATADVNAVSGLFSSMYSNAGTVNLTFGWGEVNGQSLGNTTLGGTSATLLSNQSYSTVSSLLINSSRSNPQNTVLSSVVSNLPGSNNPYANASFSIPLAEYTALTGASYSGTDAYVGFGSAFNWQYGQTGGIASGAYDFTGIAMHEITHALGRLNYEFVNPTPFLTPLDLTRYSCGTTTLNSTSGSTGCFSINGGLTDIATYSALTDTADLNGATIDPFNANLTSGTTYTLTSVGGQIMQSLGWTLAATSASSTTLPEPGSIFLVFPVVIGMLRKKKAILRK